MKMTLELELADQPDPTDFQNFLGYAAKLDRKAVSGLTGLVPKGLPATPLVDQSTDEGETSTETATTTTGRPRGRPRRTTSAEQATAALEGASDPVVQPESGALPPGVTTQSPPAAQPELNSLPPGVTAQPVAAAPVAQPAGLPPGVGPAAQPVAATITAPAAQVPAMPPAAQVPAMPPAAQVPAMPVVPPAAADGGITIADLQASYAEYAKKNSVAAFNFLKSEKWADGTPRPRWLAISQVAPEHFERMLMELSSL